MKVLVTGASGFLGHAVCAELRDRDHEVAALVRRPGLGAGGHAPRCSGDLTDAGRARPGRSRRRPDCVIHLAAEIASQRDAGEDRARSTSRARAGCSRPAPPPARRGSSSPRPWSPATRTARCSTRTRRCRSRPPTGAPSRRASGSCASRACDNVIIRPSHVYGPGGWFEEEFVKRLRQPGRFAVIGSGENWWDVVRVEDVATRLRRRGRARARRGPLPRRRRRADPLLRLRRAHRRGARRRPPRRIPAWLARARRGRRPGAGRGALGAQQQRPHQARARLAPRFPTAREGVPDAVAQLSAVDRERHRALRLCLRACVSLVGSRVRHQA